jgi:hypothetical protein
MVSIRIKAMECLCPNSQSLAAAPTCLGSVVLIVALTLVPPGKSQMLMNLAPQALPNSPVGPAYTGTLDAVNSVSTPLERHPSNPRDLRHQHQDPRPVPVNLLKPIILLLWARSVN